MTTPHPAKFSKPILETLTTLVQPDWVVLDPFAGVGGIHQLPCHTIGIEIEPEWAAQHDGTMCADARNLSVWGRKLPPFDAIITSPCYGNRMADNYDGRDGSARNTYRTKLGRALTPGNAGGMQWGRQYRELHQQVWAECVKVLKPRGHFILNVSNHIRKGNIVPVTEWHIGVLCDLGLTVTDNIEIKTQRNGFGANGKSRVDFESIVVFTK